MFTELGGQQLQSSNSHVEINFKLFQLEFYFCLVQRLMAIDSRVAFQNRAAELGIEQDDIEALAEKGINNYIKIGRAHV